MYKITEVSRSCSTIGGEPLVKTKHTIDDFLVKADKFADITSVMIQNIKGIRQPDIMIQRSEIILLFQDMMVPQEDIEAFMKKLPETIKVAEYVRDNIDKFI